MRRGARKILMAMTCGAALVPACAHAEDGFDTEHIFGFVIGTDVGNVGEREFQSETTGRFGKGSGTYRAIGQELEIELVPLPNLRIELGATATMHDITGVPDIDDRRQLNFQGASIDLRYRLLERERAPFGLAIAVEGHGDRIDETTGVKDAATALTSRSQSTVSWCRDFAIGALNLIYQPEWARIESTGLSEEELHHRRGLCRHGARAPNVLLGGRAALLSAVWKALVSLSSQARPCSSGPTAYFQLVREVTPDGQDMEHAGFWGRARRHGRHTSTSPIFERHQARLVFGVNFWRGAFGRRQFRTAVPVLLDTSAARGAAFVVISRRSLKDFRHQIRLIWSRDCVCAVLALPT